MWTSGPPGSYVIRQLARSACEQGQPAWDMGTGTARAQHANKASQHATRERHCAARARRTGIGQRATVEQPQLARDQGTALGSAGSANSARPANVETRQLHGTARAGVTSWARGETA